MPGLGVGSDTAVRDELVVVPDGGLAPRAPHDDATESPLAVLPDVGLGAVTGDGPGLEVTVLRQVAARLLLVPGLGVGSDTARVIEPFTVVAWGDTGPWHASEDYLVLVASADRREDTILGDRVDQLERPVILVDLRPAAVGHSARSGDECLRQTPGCRHQPPDDPGDIRRAPIGVDHSAQRSVGALVDRVGDAITVGVNRRRGNGDSEVGSGVRDPFGAPEPQLAGPRAGRDRTVAGDGEGLRVVGRRRGVDVREARHAAEGGSDVAVPALDRGAGIGGDLDGHREPGGGDSSRRGVGHGGGCGVRGRGDGDATHESEAEAECRHSGGAQDAHDDSLLPVFQAGLRLQRGLSPRGDAPRA